MPTSDFICPLCQYKAPLPLFENVGDGQMRCRRCRSKFPDPNAYDAAIAYADCDSQRAVSHFPFSLGGDTRIRVRDGYLALIIGAGGQRSWVTSPDYQVSGLSDASQVYYVCLSPWITWGTRGVREFGVYGIAQLSLSPDYVRAYCDRNGNLLSLEEHLQDAMSDYAACFVRAEIDKQSMGLLEAQDDYLNMLGQVEEGVTLVRIQPMGYRNAGGQIGYFSTYVSAGEPMEIAAPLPAFKAPVELLSSLPKAPYTIKEDVEEVFWFGPNKAERHKAGEIIDADQLRGVKRVFRYRSKVYELPFGWGVYNQPQAISGFFSAQGTISFHIDSTVRMGELLGKTKSWQEFDDQFFFNVLKKELSTAMTVILSDISRKEDFNPARMNSYLSAMSVNLTNLLNGEGVFGSEPVFRQHGLRVMQADILSIDLYPVRR